MCFWGGQNCLGHKNTEETKPFCSYGGFYESFCDRNWKHWKIMERLFACKKLGAKNKKCPYVPMRNQKEIISKCDSSSMWTTYTCSRESLSNNYDNILYYVRYDISRASLIPTYLHIRYLTFTFFHLPNF